MPMSHAVVKKRKVVRRAAKFPLVRVPRVRAEIKNIETAPGQAGFPSISPFLFISPINLLFQGPGGSQRIGRRIYVHSVDVRFTAIYPLTGSGDNRLLLVWDNECRGALATESDILESVGANAGYLSPINKDNIRRFVVLFDSYKAPVTGSSAINSPVVTYHRRVKVNKYVDYFNTTTGLISDIEKGALLLCSQNSTTVTGANLNFHTRVNFSDA